MACNGVGQQGELAVIEIDMAYADRAGKLGSARPVHGILAVALATRVVQEGKVFDDLAVRAVQLRKVQPVAPDPHPMRGSVQSPPLKAEGLPQAGDESGCDRQSAIAEARIDAMRRMPGFPAEESA